MSDYMGRGAEFLPDDDDYEMLIECDACDGDGWLSADGISIECPECGGEGWI